MLGHHFRRHPVATSAMLLGLAFCAFFVARLVVATIYWSDPEHRRMTPEAWMTPRYIAHSWDMDPRDVRQAVGMTQRPGNRPTLEHIARMRDVPITQVLDEVRALIAEKGHDQ